MDHVIKTVRAGLKKETCPEVEKVHSSLSIKDKQTAFMYKKAYIEAKGDKIKRRKARKQSEKWVEYMIDVGKIQKEDKDMLMWYLCPI